MARGPRQLIGGHCYHVINRGNGRARVFHSGTDYLAFVRMIAAAQARTPMRLLAACLMPNHFHLVVQPFATGELSRWMHWLMTKHVTRHRRAHDTTGHIWQGRFKPFLIQQDAHLLAVMRYVERNALRAGLVQQAEYWPWGTLHWRSAEPSPVALSDPPAGLPARWAERVNEPQTSAELEAMRRSVNTGEPFGDPDWANGSRSPGVTAA